MTMDFRRCFSLFLAVILLLCTVPLSLAEEEDGEGTVTVIDHTDDDLPAEMELVETEPFIPFDQDKTVFYPDGRTTVKSPSKYPYSAIAYLDVRGECGCSWTGSGFMVNSDRLLTAAHCLVCTKHSKWAKKITFYFGYKSSRNYLYKYTGRWYAYAGNLFRDKEYTTDWDYGCIKLDKKVGNKVGWFGTRWGLSDDALDLKFYYLAGYRDGTLKYDAGYVDVLSSQHIKYKMDTQPGYSGGPVYSSDYYAVGINIAENSSYNIGYRLTKYVKNDLDDL